ncbi:galactosylgalactosylxylosylprotein 3-beta-glucuronosyltransferase I isoform X2 [Plodia interpunctella]|uniref:galactosylgalactosylxylosylprotein 3-beta-glucuronosyltransferase I isoform X2 n=1 Tax=Plodia interpunctella TaxID=58824 RepID=UPI0023674CBB|nr:galactosylgalactosylxylosylprotein 3-beta-glucuronosyltransferase I isoform X2 [Plodia interpunctella]
MPFGKVKKQYLAIAMLIFVLLFFFNSKPAFQCLSPEIQVSSYLPTIYAITPTYTRLAQKADLTRLSQTLMHVKNFHWIIVEDSEKKTDLVANFLKESGLNYTHLNVKTQASKHSSASGVEQRNLALKWLRDHLKKLHDKRGVIYFMDDDNTYALKVFDEMRKINKVGTWPVGIVGGMRVEMPLVTDGKITGFNAVWKPFRPFPIDMAGFAINSTLLLEQPDAKFSRKVQSGYQESEILKYFTKKEDLEPLADNCTKVYVWHTRTQKPSIITPKKWQTPVFDSHIEV